MKLSFCGIVLRRIVHDDIEMLRSWRNDKKIAGFMFYQEYITSEMQEKWFQSLSSSDYYFIIEVDRSPLGLIHLAKDKEEVDCAHAGLFIYDESYWGSQIPVLASLCLLRFAFEQLLLKQVKAKVRKENTIAWKYNERLGFCKISDELQQLNVISYKSRLHKIISQTEKTFS